MIAESGIDFDWAFWIDADDELVNGENIQKMLSDDNKESAAIFLKYVYGYDSNSKKEFVTQYRERFLSLSEKWTWINPVHEICQTRVGIKMRELEYADKYDIKILHYRGSFEDEGSSIDNVTRIRNREILNDALLKNPNDLRSKYYLANEIAYECFKEFKNPTKEGLAHSLGDQAISIYLDFVNSMQFNDDVYVANTNIANIYRMQGKINEAIDRDMQNIKMQPDWIESWAGLSQSFLSAGMWNNAESFSDIMISSILEKNSKKSTAHVKQEHVQNHDPYVCRAIARRNLGNFSGAIEDLNTAYEFFDSELAKEQLQLTLDKQEELDGESLGSIRAKLLNTKKEKSVAFFVPPAVEAWHPKYVDQFGSGGAEHCVIEIASRFAEDGYRTVIFGRPGEYEGVDKSTNIEWWDSGRFDPTEKFSAFISSRHVGIIESQPQADKKLLWLHDVNSGPDAEKFGNQNRFDLYDKVVCLTEWHRETNMRYYGNSSEKAIVIPNGIDMKYFKDVKYDRPLNNKFIYSSSLDRGFITLLDYWPEIRSRHSDAELHVFYGWDIINKLISMGHTGLQIFKDSVENKINALGGEKAGIVWHGRVKRQDLIDTAKECSWWAYPTQFCETFCITALEQQLSGNIPLTSNLAALGEVVGAKKLLTYGWPNNDTYKKDWFAVMDSLYNAPFEEIHDIRMVGKKHAEQYTWDHAYDIWRKAVAS